MKRVLMICLLMLFSILTGTRGAKAADLTEEYFVGRWAISENSCSDPTGEFVVFHATGSVENIDEGELQAAGFWTIADDLLQFEVVASPAFFDDRLQHMEGQFYAFPLRLVPFEVQSDSFQTIGVLGAQVKRATFKRCKA